MSTLVTTALRHNASASNNMVLDSSGRVGIGTAAPGVPLQVNGTSSQVFPVIVSSAQTGTAVRSNPVYRIQSEAAGRDVYMQFSDNISNSTEIGMVGGSQYFCTGAVERMRIDASGRVTMPAQPIFLGAPTIDYSGGSMPTGVIAFTALFNNGNHYNAATSRFTIPVSGWYRTTWGGLQIPNTVTSLQVNGSRNYNGNHVVGTLNYVTMTQTVVRSFSAGDFLTIEGWNGGGYFASWYLWSVELVA